MASGRALVNSEVLRWARESRGLEIEEVARRLRVRVKRVEDWERGEVAPTVKQLRRLARLYARSFGLLYLSEPLEESELGKDFRRLPEAERSERSAALALEVRLAQDRRQEAIEIAEALDEEPPRLGVRARLDEDPEVVARRLRRRLRVRLAEQTAWRDAYVAFNGWRTAIEARGVLVFQTGGKKGYAVEPTEARGFSVTEEPYPVVVANGRDAPSARCFTLLHELAHVALREGGLCDLHERRSDSERDRVEAFCNRVAGAILVPREALAGAPEVARHGRERGWADEELAALSRRFGVSREVVLLRLLTLGRASRSFYQDWKARQAPPPASDGGFLPPFRRAIKRNGHLYPRLVLAAYEERRIPLSDAVDMLDVGPQHFSGVERLAFEDRAP